MGDTNQDQAQTVCPPTQASRHLKEDSHHHSQTSSCSLMITPPPSQTGKINRNGELREFDITLLPLPLPSTPYACLKAKLFQLSFCWNPSLRLSYGLNPQCDWALPCISRFRHVRPTHLAPGLSCRPKVCLRRCRRGTSACTASRGSGGFGYGRKQKREQGEECCHDHRRPRLCTWRAGGRGQKASLLPIVSPQQYFVHLITYSSNMSV